MFDHKRGKSFRKQLKGRLLPQDNQQYPQIDEKANILFQTNKKTKEDSIAKTYGSSKIPQNSDVKNWEKVKFEQKLLVWTAISNAGIAQCYFVPSGLVIDQDVYLNECIK